MHEYLPVIAFACIVLGLSLLPAVLHASIGYWKWILFGLLPVAILGGLFYFDNNLALETARLAAIWTGLIVMSYILGRSVQIHFSYRAGPSSNTLLLAVGIVLSYIIGSVGATVALLPVFLSANRSRRYSMHLALAFYLAVWLKGGLPVLALNPAGAGIFPDFWNVNIHFLLLTAGVILTFLLVFLVLEIVIFAREPVHYDDNRNLALELRESIRDNEVRTSKILRAVDLLEEKATTAYGGFSLWAGALATMAVILLKPQYSWVVIPVTIIAASVYALKKREWRFNSVFPDSFRALMLYYVIAVIVLYPLVMILGDDLKNYDRIVDPRVTAYSLSLLTDPALALWISKLHYGSDLSFESTALLILTGAVIVSAHPGWKLIRTEARLAGVAPGPWYARIIFAVILAAIPLMILFFFQF